MKANELTITISGKTSTGKSALLYYLRSLLKDEGFDIILECGDYKDVEEFEEKVGEYYSKVLREIKTKPIIMREMNVVTFPRSGKNTIHDVKET